jgi:hypothetical protein
MRTEREDRASAAARSPAPVAVFERRDPVPARVWALWLGSLAFVGVISFAILLAR